MVNYDSINKIIEEKEIDAIIDSFLEGVLDG